MVKDMIFGVVGGLGLFLFGMAVLSGGLKRVAGQRLRKILSALTKHRVVAVVLGALTTCLVQSSSATTVIVIGLVNASLLTLKQALCVVFGANIGTTITAWMISGLAVFKITSYALPAIAVGFLLQTLGKSQKIRNIGEIILGFGVLFVGIGFMKDAFGPLKDSARAQEILIFMGRKPLLALLAGTVTTMLLQSSSATIALLQMLAFNGAFGSADWHIVLRVVIPFILGDNIGTTITAQIAAAGASAAARRTAWGHTLFNVIGTMYMWPLIVSGWFADAVEWITPFRLSQQTIMVHIAAGHTMFNVFNALVFLPLVGWLEVLVVKIVPARAADAISEPVVLEEHLLNTPEIAIDQARREILRMAGAARKAVNQAIEGLDEDDRKKLQMVQETEDVVDNFQYEITSYLAELATKELSNELSIELPVLLHTVNDLERVGDHAVNIAEIAERKIEHKLSFSDSAKAEGAQLKSEVNQMFDHVSASLENNDTEAAKSALVNEGNLNRMQMDFRRSHVQRMTEGDCSPEAGLIFIDLVDNMEKIGDHLTNIAQAVIGGLQWDGVEPKTIGGA
ncbi:MAG TPA: Na/Pi cotransporter family protein [Sedimentisphaerales bacterium]|nr:Na/Pi cotransporter family protein [Sedimentisphaerales bacterium]